MDTQPTLLSRIEKFLLRHDMDPTTFGRLAKKDPNFVFDLRGGRDVRSSTERTVLEFMAEHDRVHGVVPEGEAAPTQRGAAA